MRIPDKINVLGREYEVIIEDGLFCESEKVDGLCDHERHSIHICRYLPKSEKPEVFLHEFIHAALWELGVSRQLSADVEEVIADGLGKALVKTFKMRLNKDN
jgi:hypothetical protein